MKVIDLLSLKVSMFKSCKHTLKDTYKKDFRIGQVLMMGSEYVDKINHLRQFSGKETEEIESKYKELKSQLPVFTMSCLCGNNGSSDIVQTHNVICLDIDLQDNPDMDPELAKEKLIKLPSVFYVSLSVGGKGIFGLMGLTGSDSFKERFNSVKEYVYKQTGLVVDKVCSNPNRLRFVSYDENPVFKDFDSEIVLYQGMKSDNPSSMYKPILNLSLPKKKYSNDFDDLLDDDKFCVICSDYCINRLGFKTQEYSNWLSHMGCLSTLGVDGERLGVELSRQSPNYKSDEEVIKIMRTLSKKSGQRKYLTRYFKMCKESLGKNWIRDLKKMYEIK